MKICLFGGTFNPVHNGHINIIEKVLEYISPDKLYVIPSGNSYFKQHVIDKEHRYNMTRLALNRIKDARVELSDIEIKREGPSYSIVTIDYFLELNNNCELYFIIGEDTLYNINKWYKAEEILSKVTLVVLRRNSVSINKSQEYIDEMQSKYNNKCILIDYDYPISSSQIRQMILDNKDISEYIDNSVLDYINNNKLYYS